jgi:RNA polymerase sigma factor (sigma-70 family)
MDDPTPRGEPAGARRADPAGQGDRQLVEACLGGDQEAWSQLIHKYRRMVYSIPLKYGGNVEDAADVFQSVCLELFSELPNLRKTDSVQAWLMTVTAHHCLRWKKRGWGRRERGPERAEPAAAAHARTLAIYAEVEREQALRSTVDRLPPRCRRLVALLFYEDPARPYAEVARSLGLATGSIGLTRRRCLECLRRLLVEQGD